MVYFNRTMTVDDMLFFLQTMVQDNPVSAKYPVAFVSGTSVTPVTTMQDSGLVLRLEGRPSAA